MLRAAFRLFVAVLSVAVAFAVVGCTATEPPPINQPAEPAPVETPAETPPEAPTEAPQETVPAGNITPQQAIDIALDLVPGGAAVDVESSQEGGRPSWEIIVRQPDGSGTEIYLDVETGDVIKQERATVPREARTAAPAFTATQAIDVALATVPGSLIELELDTEGGRTVWEAYVDGAGGRMEIYIDAANGEVIKQERAD